MNRSVAIAGVGCLAVLPVAVAYLAVYRLLASYHSLGLLGQPTICTADCLYSFTYISRTIPINSTSSLRSLNFYIN